MDTTPVRYYCPRCGAVVALDREPYLDDKSVTAYPLEGWEYAAPDGAFEDADGVRIVCGDPALEWSEDGCGDPFYLNFVRFEGGREVEPVPEPETVELAAGRGPRGPPGPGEPGR